MGVKFSHFLRPPEIFILTTIVLLAAVVTMMTIQESRKAVRDNQRRQDIDKFFEAASNFKDDYGFYPNYSMTLGLGKDKNQTVNYDLASPLSQCSDHFNWMVGVDLTTPERNFNKAYLKPGFQSVSDFLVCLGYLQKTSHDPLWARTISDYHYRVSYDYQKIVVQATSERSGLIYRENGLSNRNLWEESDTTIAEDNNYYQGFLGRDAANSQYVYQCLLSVEGDKLSVKQRASAKYAPFVQDTDLSWVPNSLCKDSLKGLQVVTSR